MHLDKTHLWHMETRPELWAADGLLYPAAYLTVDTTDAANKRSRQRRFRIRSQGVPTTSVMRARR